MCWAGRPGYIPPPALSPNQVTIYALHDKRTPGLINPPRQLADRQDYDLEEVVSKIEGEQPFDLICVSSGANENNQPRNLAAFDCPKVLLVGDTHHITENPIHFVIDYLKQEQYDVVISMHNRDHTKWFRHVPGLKLGWIPGLTAQDIPVAFNPDRERKIAFVGSWRLSHPRRKNFIQKLHDDSLPFDHQRLSRQASAPHYANALIAFNCTLNGDLNMRVHEILSSGGFLLMDKLAAASGLDNMLEHGKDYVSYSSYPEFREIATYYLDHPDEAITIARHGLETYQRDLRPEYLAEKFLQWVLRGKHPQFDYAEKIVEIPGVNWSYRLQVYEYLQNLQLRREKTQALYFGVNAGAAADDIKGLVRVFPRVLRIEGHPFTEDNNIRLFSQEQLAGTNWPVIVVDKAYQSLLDELGISGQKVFEF